MWKCFRWPFWGQDVPTCLSLSLVSMMVRTLRSRQLLGQRLQRDSRRRDGQADSQILQVYGLSRIQQVHLQTNWVYMKKLFECMGHTTTGRLMSSLWKLRGSKWRLTNKYSPSCSTGWITCLCLISFKFLRRIFSKAAIFSCKLSTVSTEDKRLHYISVSCVESSWAVNKTDLSFLQCQDMVS